MKKYGPKNQLCNRVEPQKMDLSNNKNNVSCWNICDIKLFGRDRSQVLKVLEQNLALGTKKYWIATVNPEFVMTAQKDNEFKKILSKTSLNVVDGIGLIWARELAIQSVSSSAYQIIRSLKKLLSGFMIGVKVLKGEYKDQIASGADLMVDLVKLAAKDNKKVFFLGGWGDRAEKTAKFFETKNLDCRSSIVDRRNKLKIDWCSGEPDVTNEEVIKKINSFKPDILFVAYGMKKQEFWINENLNKLNVGLVMGVGRSFDYYSGELKRAPQWVQKMGMEWLYSLIKEPKRFRRQLVLPRFIQKVISGEFLVFN